jgi:hypothetical protein
MRVLNDSLDAPTVNGPSSDPTLLRAGRYHLRFNAQSGSTYERCVDDLARFTIEQGEPWFRSFGDCQFLLNAEDSPLHPASKERPMAAMSGRRIRKMARVLRIGISEMKPVRRPALQGAGGWAAG